VTSTAVVDGVAVDAPPSAVRATIGSARSWWRRFSLRAKTLAAASLGVAALLAVDGVISVRTAWRDGRAALLERAELLAGVEADALAMPLWDFDDAQVGAVIDALSLDPDFRAALVRDADGKPLAGRAGDRDEGEPSPTIRARREIVYRDGGERRVLGVLELELSTDRLTAALLREAGYRAVTFLALVGAVLTAVYVAFRQVTRPLDLMAQVTTRLAAGDRAVAVPGLDRADEIGAVARAIQVLKENATALARAEEKYRAVYENAALGIYRSSPDGRMLAANPALVRFNGYGSERELLEAYNSPDAIGRSWYVEPGRREDFARAMRERGEVAGFVSRVRRRDGEIAWISESARAVRDEAGAVLSYEGTVEDITERKRLEEEERLRVRAAVESACDAIAITDAEGTPTYLNPAFVALLGYDLAQLTAAGGPAALFAESGLAREVFSALRTGDRWSGEAELEASDGRVVPVAIRASAIVAREGGAVGSVLILTDITERRETEARIRHMAHHDALTGLPNRLLFRDRLQQALARAPRAGEGVAVLCLDLDRFKEVNDTLGHAFGDRLLEAVTERLQAGTREADTVARLGGDEFAVVQVGLAQPEGADALARRLTEALSRPFDLDGHEVLVGTSVGVALFPVDGDDPERLLRRADLALYRAKAEGRGTHRFFEEQMDAHLRARRALEHDLRRAIAERRLELHYQPQVDLTDGRVVGAEALLRWRHPERGHVPPAEFVPLAEETGLIVPLGDWVLKTACAAAAAWRAPLQVAVNLSPVQFRQPDLAGAVERILRGSGLEPSRLELEVTEGVLLQETEATLATLRHLKALGVRIALDDFGTGYSSLSYLRRFPFDKIKIDRSFVRGLGQESGAAAIVRAVVALSRSLGMRSNAEGVETDGQAELLLAEGCGEVQGFRYGRPMPGDAFAALVAGCCDPIAETVGSTAMAAELAAGATA
jgi:diguanylate cyclase (GGDEF)-like protein/PAS domain S-box-containing protein